MMENSNGNNNGAGKVLNFIEARKKLIEEHGTASRGARSPLLDPIRKALKAPANASLFDSFIRNPDSNYDLIRNLAEDHGIQAPAKEIFQALAHLGIEKLLNEACEQYRPDFWRQSVDTARAATRLAVAVSDWSSAEKIWLQLEERAIENGSPDPRLQQQVLFELGALLTRRGEHDSATEYYLLCETLARADNDLSRLASIRIQLGGAFLELKQSEEALRCFQMADDYLREGAPDKTLAADIALGAAIARAQMGDLAQALSGLERSLEISANGGAPATRAAAFFHRSRVLSGLGRDSDAFDSLASAIGVAREDDNLDSRITLLYELFDVCIECGRWGDFFLELLSCMDYVHAAEQFRLLGSLLVLSAKANSERGLFHLALRNLEEAAYLYNAFEDSVRLDEVNKAIERIRAEISKQKNPS